MLISIGSAFEAVQQNFLLALLTLELLDGDTLAVARDLLPSFKYGEDSSQLCPHPDIPTWG